MTIFWGREQRKQKNCSGSSASAGFWVRSKPCWGGKVTRQPLYLAWGRGQMLCAEFPLQPEEQQRNGQKNLLLGGRSYVSSSFLCLHTSHLSQGHTFGRCSHTSGRTAAPGPGSHHCPSSQRLGGRLNLDKMPLRNFFYLEARPRDPKGEMKYLHDFIKK